jgi:hypothetical protein
VMYVRVYEKGSPILAAETPFPFRKSATYLFILIKQLHLGFQREYLFLTRDYRSGYRLASEDPNGLRREHILKSKPGPLGKKFAL